MQPLLFAAPEPTVASDAVSPRAVAGGKRWVEITARDQMSLVVRRTEDLVPQDALVRVIDQIVELLDFSEFEGQHPGGGRPAFHPRFLGKIMIYGLCMGVLSARELSRRVERDTHFMWLAHEMSVDHEVFSDLRRRFGKQLKGLFRQTVSLGVQIGLVSFGCIAIDGTKIAAAARRRALNKDELDKAIAKLDERIEKLLAEAEALDAADEAEFGQLRGDEIPRQLADAKARREKLEALLPAAAENPDRRISPTDPEAPMQKTQDGKRPGYNAQIAVDEKVGFIVAEDVTDEQNDTQQFAPMADQVVDNLGIAPQTLVADTGYHAAEALEYLARQPELNAYINQQPTGTPGLYGHEDFEYDAATDSYLCPARKRLVFKGFKTFHDTQSRWYRSEHTCAHCELRAQCFAGKMPYRQLVVRPHGQLAVAMKCRLCSDEGKRALRTRTETAERTFGTIKARLGLRQLLARGLSSARSQFSLVAIAVNVRKLSAWIEAHGWTPAAATPSG